MECSWLVCLSDELIRKYGLVHPECLRSAFYSLYRLFLSIRTYYFESWNGTFWRTEKPLSQYGKGFLAVVFSDNCDACNVIRLIVRTLSYFRILVYMRACGCVVAYNVLSRGWLCIIMQSVDGFSLSGIWHQTSTGWHVAVMNFGFLYSEDMSVCIGQKDRIWLRQWCGRQIRIVPSIVYLLLVF